MEDFFKGIRTILISLLFITISLGSVSALGYNPSLQSMKDNMHSETTSLTLLYQTKKQNADWEAAVQANTVSGTSVSNAPITAISLSIPESIGNIRYRAHVADLGWQEWVGDSMTAAAPNEDKPVQAIQIELTGSAEEYYDIYYHVNVANVGWLDWAKNGEVAGTVGLAENIEEVQVTYVSRDSSAPGPTTCSSLQKEMLSNVQNIDYQAHVSYLGWMDNVTEGNQAGTTGLSKATEAMIINLEDPQAFGDNSSISYNVYSSDVGWTGEVSNGEVAGTTGQSHSAEGFNVNLHGRLASAYDVYYRAHLSYYGWLGWAKNGQLSGSTGIATPMEAFEIKLVPKGSAAPGSTDRSSITRESLQAAAKLDWNTHVENEGWQGRFGNNDIGGTMGQSKRMEAIQIALPNLTNGSSINYQVHVQDDGWQPYQMSNGGIAGTTGQSKKIECITINLKGEDDYSYDIYYRAYCQNLGWLGWAKDGDLAGTTGGDLRLEALQICLVPRCMPGPGNVDGSGYRRIERPKPPVEEGWRWPLDGYIQVTSGFGYREGGEHLGIDIPAPAGTPIHAAKSGTVTLASWYYGYGNCVIVRNDKTDEQVYYAHMSAINCQPGQHVNQYDVIGFVGDTGTATCNHLHLGLVSNGNWCNPLDVFD